MKMVAHHNEFGFNETNVCGEESKMIRVLSDIASRMLTDTPAGDRVANFASRMSDQLEKGKGDAFKTKDVVDGPGFSKRNRDIAKATLNIAKTITILK